VIDLDQIEHDVVQEARQDPFLRLALLERVGRALEHVGRRRKAPLEEIEERRLLRHRLEDARLGAADAEDGPGATTHGQWIVGGALLVDRVHHVVLEGVGQRLGRHRLDCCRTTDRREKGPAIDLHRTLLRGRSGLQPS
jgi:hypothetical protein